mmetsp:Transcript_25328/g.55624  ORF Transcript_25328/g.55624 Transcript_25328/m.55624 type:complete len:103 (-) Transcript_25328:306-614(-)
MFAFCYRPSIRFRSVAFDNAPIHVIDVHHHNECVTMDNDDLRLVRRNDTTHSRRPIERSTSSRPAGAVVALLFAASQTSTISDPVLSFVCACLLSLCLLVVS